MANVLKDEKKQQIIALGRLGWSLRKIQQATRVRRETISAYLRGAGVEIWPPGRWKREGKAVVQGILDRTARQVRAKVMPDVKRETLQAEILKQVLSVVIIVG